MGFRPTGTSVLCRACRVEVAPWHGRLGLTSSCLLVGFPLSQEGRQPISNRRTFFMSDLEIRDATNSRQCWLAVHAVAKEDEDSLHWVAALS